MTTISTMAPSAGSAVAPRARIAQSSGPIDQGRCDNATRQEALGIAGGEQRSPCRGAGAEEKDAVREAGKLLALDASVRVVDGGSGEGSTRRSWGDGCRALERMFATEPRPADINRHSLDAAMQVLGTLQNLQDLTAGQRPWCRIRLSETQCL